MHVQTLTVGPLEENAYLIWEGGEGILVDPGAEPERLEAAIAAAGFAPTAILLTHAHFDHLGAVAPLAESNGLPVFLHRADLPLYQNAPALAASFGLSIPEPPEPSGFLEEGETVFGLKVLHLPGHSPGHLAFYAKAEEFVLSGDLLFKGGIGRYDLPAADRDTLFASLRRLLSLPEATRVLHGHGPATTIGGEKQTNPFLAGLG